ncbi:cation transporter [Thermophilibacter sp. ET337]|uniref:cation transporter n=1 Tax=Thermophilibacter sp. ET337 TaxID=2973084 RepID=UPI0021ACE857|nr:cation transporter [Thermophilibacter sp. ET337]MCR8907378.1 cation transporter [Thermophilibacter sp. ET337]
MRKSFKLDEIDCANCARKLQDALAKLDGVDAVSVNFMTQKLTLAAADERFDEVLDRVVALSARVEPDCEIVR